MLLWRERVPDEEVRDSLVFFTMEENAESLIHRPTCPANLLVIVDDGIWTLKVNNKPKIGLVEPHAQGNRCNQRLHLVVQQFLLKDFALWRFPLWSRHVGMVGFCANAVPPKPFGYTFGITYGQRIDNAASRQAGNRFRQPRQPGRRTGHDDVLKLEAFSHQGTSYHLEVVSELRDYISDNTVIRSGSCRQHGDVSR